MASSRRTRAAAAPDGRRPQPPLLHDPSRWPAQRNALSRVRDGKVKSGASFQKVLVEVSHDLDDPDSFGGAKAIPFAEFDPEWWASTLPFIARLALASEVLLQRDEESARLFYLPPNVPGTVKLPRLHVASILALAFFDAIPPPEVDPSWEMPDHLSFSFWLSCNWGGAEAQKALCLAGYFAAAKASFANDLSDSAIATAVETAGSDADAVTIMRLVLPDASSMSLQQWKGCEAPLMPLTVVPSGGIEGAPGALQADFANEYLGGGVLHSGNVQEEIRFSICPECLVGMLICPRMRPSEAIVIDGVRQYASYRGYGGGFTYTGPYDTTHGDQWGPGPAAARFGPPETVVAIDAKCYYFEDPENQYSGSSMLRELTKLRAALGDGGPLPRDGGEGDLSLSTLSPRRAFATGNWGCGVFGGDARHKALLQWMAASYTRRPILYYPFGDPKASGLAETAAKLLAAKVTVGQLARALLAGDRQECSNGRAFACVEKRLCKQ